MIDNQQVSRSVALSLAEDIGEGDITAELIDPQQQAKAKVITREPAMIAGQPWFTEVYRQVDAAIELHWLVAEGDPVVADQVLVELHGPARTLLTGERTALNWLQTLSGVATITHHYVQAIGANVTKLLDTRKTLPGLRYAEKYAVTVGGGHNHRMGLFDAYLVKENHIRSCGSIEAAIEKARGLRSGLPVEVEVESLDELEQALAAKVDIILLDNFTVQAMQTAVALNQGRAKLEVSGNVGLETIQEIAQTGVDYVSVGALTKNVQAIDLSLQFDVV